QFIVSDDAVVIRDVGSTNGTFVNGAPVVSETSLQTGHQIQLGSVPLLFEADDISPSSPLPGVPASPTLPSADLTPPPSPPARLRVALQASHAPARAEVV